MEINILSRACTYRASKDLCPSSSLTLYADIESANVPKFSNRLVLHIAYNQRHSLGLSLFSSSVLLCKRKKKDFI